MPKQKTNKALTKRIKITGSGKIRCHRTGTSHLKSVKSPKRLRRMRKETQFPTEFRKHVKRLLGI